MRPLKFTLMGILLILPQSLAWASTIVPQNCGLLKLPVEVRHKIWSLVFENLSCGNEPIRPMKKGMKFYSPTWPEAPKETAALSETCRQIYVDVVGGGLLYRAKQFSFTPGLMLNYLWVVRICPPLCISSKTFEQIKLSFWNTTRFQSGPISLILAEPSSRSIPSTRTQSAPSTSPSKFQETATSHSQRKLLRCSPNSQACKTSISNSMSTTTSAPLLATTSTHTMDHHTIPTLAAVFPRP